MTRKLIRILAILFTVIACAILLPRLYRMTAKSGSSHRNVVYSEILRDFIITEYKMKSKAKLDKSPAENRDTHGGTYTSDQVDSLTVLNNAARMAFNGTFPDSLCGVAITPELVAEHDYKVYYGDRGGEHYGIYEIKDKMLFKSKKHESQELFRFTDSGIEFIDTRTNTVNKERSDLFTGAMTEQGFTFPGEYLWISADRVESEQLGYFINDAKGKLFRMAMNEGKPEIEIIPMPDGASVSNMKFTDNPEFLAMVITTDGATYAMNRDYSYIRMPLPSAKRRGVAMYANLFYRTFEYQSENHDQYYVTDTQYNLVDSLVLPRDNSKVERVRDIEQILFPFVVRANSRVGFQVSCSSPLLFLWVNLICLAIFIVMRRRAGERLCDSFVIADMIMVAIFGIFGLLAQLLIPRIKHSKTDKKC